jgi:hypothetical protein
MAAIWWTDKCGHCPRASANRASARARSRSSASAWSCFRAFTARIRRSSNSAASASLAKVIRRAPARVESPGRPARLGSTLVAHLLGNMPDEMQFPRGLNPRSPPPRPSKRAKSAHNHGKRVARPGRLGAKTGVGPPAGTPDGDRTYASVF